MELRLCGANIVLGLDDFAHAILVDLRVLVQSSVVVFGDLRENLLVVFDFADVSLQEVGNVLQHRFRALFEENVVELVHLLQAVNYFCERIFVVGKVFLKLPQRSREGAERKLTVSVESKSAAVCIVQGRVGRTLAVCSIVTLLCILKVLRTIRISEILWK